jgi:tRNA A-37 threonylcarbamoyl transferase component Bud32
MNDRGQALERLVESITDGTEIDWARELESHEDLQAEIRALRVIDSIARVHRDSGRLPEDRLSEPTVDLSVGPAAAVPGPPETLPRRWGPLELRELIGEGAFGQVYRAWDPALQRAVALKLLRAERAESHTHTLRFVEEARGLARVRHNNVLVVYGADRHEDRVGLWTELLEGKTLEDCLVDEGPFSDAEATNIGIELCHALAAVHGAGLVHRDVKPANVMRERGGRTVLLDFSVAAFQPTAGSSSGGRISLSGTPLCMAPELFRGEEADRTSDIYSLGVLLYRLVSGRFPVEASSIDELRERHDRAESFPLLDARPDLPPAFVQVVEKALRPDPAERYSSVGEMERALAAARGPVVDPAPTPELKPAPWWRQPAAMWAAAALVIVVLGALILRTLVFPPLQVDVSLYRLRAGAEERLLPGGRVTPGDLLFLEIQGNRDLHVYVVNEDEVGEAFALFPLPGASMQNPLAAGSVHRLPGVVDGETTYWEVSSAGGEESFLVFAAPRRLEDVERELSRLPTAGSALAARLDENTIDTLRGIGGLSRPPSQDTPSRNKKLADMYAEAASPGTGRNGVWVWHIRLSNPAPPRETP